MALVGDIGEAAPAIGYFLVLGERVGDQHELRNVILEGARQRLRRRFAFGAGAVL
jgi:hypothetical protein